MPKTNQIPNLDEVFDNYLKQHNSDHHTMREAWMDGARWMAQELIDTLYQYGTATAGIEEQRNITEGYDAAAESLTAYVYGQLLKGEGK